MAVHGCAAIAVMLIVVGSGGCNAPRQVHRRAGAEARLSGVQVQDAEVDYVSLRFDVEIRNVAQSSLSVMGYRYSLTSGANVFLSGTAVEEVAVAAGESRTLSLSDRVVYERLLRALGSQPGSTIPYDLKMWLLLRAGAEPMSQAALSGEGRLFLPEPARIADTAVRPVDVIYIGTPPDVVEKMLDIAQVRRSDLLCDLGCGDGRIVVAAAKRCGCRAVGYDIDPRRVQESRDNVSRNNLGHLVTIEQEDIFAVDLKAVDVVAIYLTPLVNRRLIPQLRTLRPGARIVSHSFPVGDGKPEQVVTLTSKEGGQEHIIYLYVTPLPPE